MVSSVVDAGKPSASKAAGRCIWAAKICLARGSELGAGEARKGILAVHLTRMLETSCCMLKRILVCVQFGWTAPSLPYADPNS